MPLGEGPRGLGTERKAGRSREDGVYERVPRNSPALFNLGAREFTRMFHDGRVEADTQGFYDSGFISPAKWKLPQGLDNALAAQAMFPVGSPAEMAGQQGENGLANARSANKLAGSQGLWDQIATRLSSIPEYVELFETAFPQQVNSADDISYVLAANAIAAFEADVFRADDSPFDRFLRDSGKLSARATRGMELFYGKANCSNCHSGTFQTDHEFHAIAMPQIGPGKSDGWNSDYWSKTGLKAFPEDFGRGRVTVKDEDKYRFRTPSLRNVTLTGPWGHDGAYTSLEAVVRHHLDPIQSLENYELPHNLLPPLPGVLELVASGSRLDSEWLNDNRLGGFLARDAWVQSNAKLRGNIAAANELDTLELSDSEVRDLLAFLECLTDPASRDLSSETPKRVPSGLPLED